MKKAYLASICGLLLTTSAIHIDSKTPDVRNYTASIRGEQTQLACTVQQESLKLVCKIPSKRLTFDPSITKKDRIISWCISILLTLFGGLMSGLTVGLASIDRLALEIEAKGDE